MTIDKRDIESFTIAYISIFFLFASTLTFNPVKTIVGLRWSYTLIVASFLALALTWLLKGIFRGSSTLVHDQSSMNKAGLSLPKNSASLRLDLLLSISLFLSTFTILAFKVIRGWPSMSPDEPIHMIIAEETYKAINGPDHGYLVQLARGAVAGGNPTFPWLNPLFPYLLTVALVPHAAFSLFSGRLLISAISSFVPPILYFMAREYGVGRKFSALTAFALSLSSLFQNQAYLYIFDGLSILLFISAFFFLTKTIRCKRKRYFTLSVMFFLLLLVTKYPPSAWLIVIYLFAAIFLVARKQWTKSEALPLVMIPLALMTLIFLGFSTHITTITRLALYGFDANTVLYLIKVIWDLTFIVGWSPYVIVAIVAYRFFQSREKDTVTFISLMAILLAFLTLMLWVPVTRRIIQVIPILFVTTIGYTFEHHSNAVTALVLLNLSWWGVLSLILLV
jgi:hypothetical protein